MNHRGRLGRAGIVVLSLLLPVLFALLPALFLYAHNAGEVSGGQVLRPLLWSVLGALGLWLLLRPLMRDSVRTGVAVSVCVVLFFSYGRLYDALSDWGLFVPRHCYLLPVMLLAAGYGIYFIRILRVDFTKPAKVMSVVAVLLVATNAIGASLGARSHGPSVDGGPDLHGVAEAESGPGEAGARPDIYYIILDEYAHPDTMLEYYGYDNRGFTDRLAGMGFFVASGSRTAYPLTHWSLAASLNMEYLPAGASDQQAFDRMACSAAVSGLKSLGYRYVYSGVWFSQEQVGADLYFNFYRQWDGDSVISDFSRALWNTTMARPFYDRLVGGTYMGHYRTAIVDQIRSLKAMPDVEGPKFVFAHIICPHAPFGFGPNGEPVDPARAFDYQDRDLYLGQYVYITRQIEELVAVILERSAAEPIIILQSDHGLREHAGLETGVDEWRKILNAYYLPGDGAQALHDSISPVNSFRVVSDHYFGTGYGLLEDTLPLPAGGQGAS